jgi:hypothetical protein
MCLHMQRGPKGENASSFHSPEERAAAASFRLKTQSGHCTELCTIG